MKRNMYLIIGLLSVAVLGLSACQKTRGFDQENVASFQRVQMASIHDYLVNNDGVTVDSSEAATDTSTKRTIIKKMSDEKLKDIHDKLVRYINLGNGVLENLSHGSSPQRDDLTAKTEAGVSDAQEWLTTIDARRSELKSKK